MEKHDHGRGELEMSTLHSIGWTMNSICQYFLPDFLRLGDRNAGRVSTRESKL